MRTLSLQSSTAGPGVSHASSPHISYVTNDVVFGQERSLICLFQSSSELSTDDISRHAPISWRLLGIVFSNAIFRYFVLTVRF